MTKYSYILFFSIFPLFFFPFSPILSPYSVTAHPNLSLYQRPSRAGHNIAPPLARHEGRRMPPRSCSPDRAAIRSRTPIAVLALTTAWPLGSRNLVARASPRVVLPLLTLACLRGWARSGGHTFPPLPPRPFSSFGSLPASPSAQLPEHHPRVAATLLTVW